VPRPAAVAVVAGLVVAGLATPAGAATAAPVAPLRSFTTTTLTFTVQVGPAEDRRTCTVLGDLRVPDGVTPTAPAPGAVLATNGFGGDKDGTGPNGNGSYAARFAEQGYVTLSYSGLGFGGSSCDIFVDDPAYDGPGRLAARQLPRRSAGHRHAATVRRTTSPGSCGRTRPGPTVAARARPRVGMVGGSYGGQAQFAIAGIDPRVDALARPTRGTTSPTRCRRTPRAAPARR
jgi:ABC-2 type transport system ATP-binding protein